MSIFAKILLSPDATPAQKKIADEYDDLVSIYNMDTLPNVLTKFIDVRKNL